MGAQWKMENSIWMRGTEGFPERMVSELILNGLTRVSWARKGTGPGRDNHAEQRHEAMKG